MSSGRMGWTSTRLYFTGTRSPHGAVQSARDRNEHGYGTYVARPNGRTCVDLGVQASGQDMNKIMMAVLQALQDEKERAEEKAAEQGAHPA